MKRLLFNTDGKVVLNSTQTWVQDDKEYIDVDLPSLTSLPLEILHSICHHMSCISVRRF